MTLNGHSNYVNSFVKLSNDQIASCSADKTIKFWNVKNGQCLKTLEAHSDQIIHLVKLSKNKVISSSSDKKIKVWDIETGLCLQTLEVHEGYVSCIDLY